MHRWLAYLRQVTRLLTATLLLMAVAFDIFPVSAALAADPTFLVNSTADTHDAKPGDGVCADATGKCTLRAAIEEADASPAKSTVTITVPAGTYLLTLGQLNVFPKNPPLTVTINGAGAKTTIVDGQQRSRVLLNGAVGTTITGVTIQGGKSTAAGGGIQNLAGSLALRGVVVQDNATEGGGGGIWNNFGTTLDLGRTTVLKNRAESGAGILNNETLTVSGSTVAGNTATEGGGGILNNGTATLKLGSRVILNVAGRSGGGIHNTKGSTLVLTSKSEVLANRAPGGDGGGIFNGPKGIVRITEGKVSLLNSAKHGGGIFNDGGMVTLTTTEVRGNDATGGGGGIFNFETQGPTGLVCGTVEILGKSTLSENHAGTEGGAIWNALRCDVTVTNSEVRGNGAPLGGGIRNRGTLTTQSATIAGNTADEGAGVANLDDGTARLTDSTVTMNAATKLAGGVLNQAKGTLALTRTAVKANTAPKCPNVADASTKPPTCN